MSNKIKTKYGSATFDKKRGYRITSRKENNHKICTSFSLGRTLR